MPCTSILNIYINEQFEYGYTDDTRYNSNMKRSRKTRAKPKLRLELAIREQGTRLYHT